MLQNCFVCMGEASTTTTSAWVTQAQLAHETRTTSHFGSRDTAFRAPTGGATNRPLSSYRPPSGRPLSAISTDVSSASRRPDSGFWSATKGFLLVALACRQN